MFSTTESSKHTKLEIRKVLYIHKVVLKVEFETREVLKERIWNKKSSKS